MRDKVKRFLSILMTALMLVNLLPVGALAEGFTISNSVQSIGWWDGYPVFVFVKVEGDTTGLTMNSDHWFTLGMVESMPGVTKPPQYVSGYQDKINGVTADQVKNRMTRYKPNKSINLDGITWMGFKSDRGASDTYDQYKNQYCWHLDGSINIEELKVNYTIRYVDENNNKEIASSKTKTGKAGSFTEVEREDIKDITGYTYTGYYDPMQKLIGGKDTVINVYYRPNSYSYRVEHYYDGEIDNSKTDTIHALYGSEVDKNTLTLKPKNGYEFEKTENCPLTIGTDESKNVIKVYYKKKADLSYTVKYLEKGTNKKLHNEKTVENQTFGAEITSASEKIDIDGYNYDSVEPEEKLTIGTGENVITFYYTKRTDLSYTVKYLEKGTNKKLHNEKTVENQTFGAEITSASEKIDIDGYNYDSVEPEEKLTIGTGENVITFYYTKRTDLSYTVNYIEKDTTNVLHEQKVQTGMKFETVINPADEKIEIDGYNYVGADKEKLTIGTDENVLTLYYTKNSYRYTVEHYWIGDKDKLDAQPFHTDADESQTALFDSTVAYQENGASWVITTNPVYTFAKADPEKITITFDPSKNVLKLYYYKNVKLIANSDTVTYDGKEHLVFGYTCAVAEMKNGRLEYVPQQPGEKPLIFDGVKASSPAGITDVGDYAVNFQEKEPIGENNGLYYVNASQTGMLTITPAPITLQASSRSKTYDGTPLEADGYGFYEGNPDLAKDIASVILTGSQTLVGSSESQITEVVLEKEKNPDNYKFTFLPGLLTVTDGTGDDPVKPENVVTKTHIPKDTGYNVGETVTFTVSVKNIYNVPKTITLTEKANVKFSNGESVIVFKDVPAGKTVKTEATYTITSADILAGVFHNTVTADFTDGRSWTAEDTVTTAELNTTLNVTKTSDVPDGQKAALGQTITYTIKVQNAGNVPYTNVKVEDPLTKLTATIETLAVGETKTFTTEYVVTEADVLKGSVLNTATATGDKIKDPKSDEPKEPNGGDEVEIKTFAPITIKPKDVTATYNGAAITGKDVEITSGKLLEGHKLSAAVIGSGVNAGSYELTLDPEKIKIVDANNKDVSEMYARTILPGKLIINKRSVRITSQSATKTYDGSALTRPAVTITGDGFVPGELAKAEATGSITKVGSTPNTIQYTTTGAFNAANYSIALSVGTLTVTEKPKPEPRRTFNLTINYVYQNGKRAAASYNRGGLKNGETFDITSPVIAGYTASETVVSGTIYNRDIKVTVIYTADGVNLDDYGVPLGLGNITMNVGDCFE